MQKELSKKDIVLKGGSSFAAPGHLVLRGVMGNALEKTIKNRLLKIDYQHLVEPFRLRNEKDNRWRCEFWGKIVRSAIWCWKISKDEALEKQIQATVYDMLSTQTPDGCISSYPADKQLGGWDIWGRKYVLLALIRYYEMVEPAVAVKTAVTKLLDHFIAQLAGRRVCDFGEHSGLAASSILGAVVGAYRITGERRFLDFAASIVDFGCCTSQNIFEAVRKGVPPSQLANGKAYEMMSCFQGLADYYRFVPNPEYKETIRIFFEAIRDNEIFVTGGGGLKDFVAEFWDNGYMNQTSAAHGALGETCVTVTWMHLCEKVMQLTGTSDAALELMHTSCNALLGAMNHDGKLWCHANPTPLAGASSKIPAGDQMMLNDGGYFYGHDCCLSQGPEGVAMAAANTVLTNGVDEVIFNYFEPMTVGTQLASGAQVALNVEGNYPFDGKVGIVCELPEPKEFTVTLLIPKWQRSKVRISVNNEVFEAAGGEYIRIRRRWENGDRLSFELDCSLRQLESPDGKSLAFFCGPLLMCRDSRLGDVNATVERGNTESKPAKAPQTGNITMNIVRELSDGTFVCDYISAGNFFCPGNMLRVWLAPKE